MVVDKDELVIAKALIESEFPRVYDWVIGDIRKCCRLKEDGSYKKGAGSLIGAFILWCCAVDYYGGLLTGVKKYHNWENKIIREDYSSRQRVKIFTEKYLNTYGNYDSNRVYDLRNSLVHNYTVKGYEVVEHDPDKKDSHLKKDEKGRYWMHLGTAISDLEHAVIDYMKDVENEDVLKINAYEYYIIHPLLKPLNPQEVNFIENKEE